jgi:Domain of unknown function (DUF4293)
MIQRIQSVYLSLITLLSLIFLKGGFLVFSEKSVSFIRVTFNGLFRYGTGQNPELVEKLLPLSVLIVLIPLISLITVLIFKNRKIQMRMSIILIILTIFFVSALIHVSFSIISKFDATIIPGIKMILPILILVLSILAYMGIRKDDRLVKSYDRLR